MALLQKSSVVSFGARRSAVAPRGASTVTKASSDRPLWFPGAVPPAYLDGSLAADRGFDPMGLSANPGAKKWLIQAELVHCRWAMLGVAGVLGQEIVRPDVFFYEAGLPQNLPAPFTNINMGGLLAWEFILMHWVETQRWADIRNHGSVNEDPIFKGNKVPNTQQGYPGGVFDPLGFSKGNVKELQTKEIKNGRLAMIAYMAFVFQAQATGKGPLACLSFHLADPFHNNITKNFGTCVVPSSVDVQGMTLPLSCLYPGHA